MQTHHQKVTADHLRRNAYLYVRQSTLRQVIENTESTRRQYALRQKATTLGWPAERVVVIDTDLGRSGASTDREGFQRLVSEVGLGRAGIVMGLEVSRLARNSSDWHRLLEICALTNTLILDEDGLYDPSHFNDRLLLGLKGTMSEAELHVLRARLDAIVTPGRVFFREPQDQVDDDLANAWPTWFLLETIAVIPFPGHELSMPAENRIWRHDCGEFHQGFAAQSFALDGQQPSLVVGQQDALLALGGTA